MFSKQFVFIVCVSFYLLVPNQLVGCEVFIHQQENFYAIPPHLLKAISLTESGRRLSNKQQVAWPWTINVEGKGYVYQSKNDAIAAVKRFQSQGVESIDVGCMQVNLKHHPEAFRHLDDAFDPQLNVAYAAQFLNSLRRQFGNWKTAVGHYHSASPIIHRPYVEKVQKKWQDLRCRAGNKIPIQHDIVYTQNKVDNAYVRPFKEKAISDKKQRNRVRKGHDQQKAVTNMPPTTFFSINGFQNQPAESYAKLTYRKFYHILPQNSGGSFEAMR